MTSGTEWPFGNVDDERPYVFKGNLGFAILTRRSDPPAGYEFDLVWSTTSSTSIVDSKIEHVGQNCSAIWRQTASRMVGGDT